MKDHWGYDKEQKPDIVEVVRCKNCIYSHYDSVLGFYWCDGVPHNADFFCASGDRISNKSLNGAPFRKNANSAPLTLEKCAESEKLHQKSGTFSEK